ncbi:large ribosomal subunit protein eL27 [Drosophila virilis]|uniref:60S ribosomal protein L27 n=1 Tax=Drosophila virilis TaxID=7244 RepID=B4LRQ4_DROVI|nr:60S ribosomal protein L27 [Drosophila virilis]EDW64656.1 uncharacterized protein Dvir_GJ21258 [Drosophila virilis]
MKIKKIYKQGKIVIVLTGRYAGCKAIIVKTSDDGKPENKPLGHALVAGIDGCTRKLTRKMGKNYLKKRSKVKTFLKRLRYTHLMPTRYTAKDVSFEQLVARDLMDPALRRMCRLESRVKFESLYKKGKNKWFFQDVRY